MAFGFNQSAGSNPQAHPAPDLEEIQTEVSWYAYEGVAFSNDCKYIRLLVFSQ